MVFIYNVVLCSVLNQPKEHFQITLFSDSDENHHPSPPWDRRHILNIQGQSKFISQITSHVIQWLHCDIINLLSQIRIYCF